MKDVMQDFLDYAREILGYEICAVESDTPDTFKKIFGISFLAMDRERGLIHINTHWNILEKRYFMDNKALQIIDAYKKFENRVIKN